MAASVRRNRAPSTQLRRGRASVASEFGTMRGAASGSGERISQVAPARRPARLRGEQEARERIGAHQRPLARAARACRRAARNRAAGSDGRAPGRERTKPPPWLTLERERTAARGEVAQRRRAALPCQGRSWSLSVGTRERYRWSMHRWSCRWWPDRRAVARRPRCPATAAAPAGPTPESCSSSGELIAPAQTITSRAARRSVGSCRRCTVRARRGARARRSRCASPAPASRTTRFGALHRRVQVGARRRHAPAVAHGDLVEADALLRGAVEVGVARQPGLGAGAQERRRTAGARRATTSADVQRPAGAAPARRAARAVLELAEVRQHVGPAPAGIAAAPAQSSKSARLAAHEDHRVDRARAAEHLAARPVAGAAGERGSGSVRYIQFTRGS